MKRLDIRQFCRTHWRILSLYGLLFVTLLVTTALKLHSLLPGYTASEVQTYQASQSLKTILHHPVNAPYLVLAWIVIKAHVSQPLLHLRIISSVLGLCTLVLFGGLLYYWHGHRVSLLGTLLFGTSDWFLHVARLGTPAILVFGLFALMTCAVWLQITESPYAIVVLLLLSAGLMYVPGMIWLIGLSILVNWKRLDNLFTKQLPVVMIATAAAGGLLIPLGWAIYQTPRIGKVILNLPSRGWPSPLSTLQHIADVPLHAFIYGQGNPIFELGHLPALPVFGVVMFGFGAYVYIQHLRLQRFRVIVGYLVGGSVVVGLGGMTNLALIVPFLYLVASAGIAYLFEQWYRVFPKNPLAQTIGVTCVAALVLFVAAYNTRAYFVSWSDAGSTRSIFKLADIGTRETSDTIRR